MVKTELKTIVQGYISSVGNGRIKLIDDKLLVFQTVLSDIQYIGLIIVPEKLWHKYLGIITPDLVKDTWDYTRPSFDLETYFLARA